MNALPAHYFVMYVPLPVGPVPAGCGSRIVQHLPVGGSSLEAMSPQTWLSEASSGTSQDIFPPRAASEAASCPIVLPNSGPAALFEWKTPEPSPRFWEGGAPVGSKMAAPDATPRFHGSAAQERHFVNGYFSAPAASSPTNGGNACLGSPVCQGFIDLTTSDRHGADRSVWPDRPCLRPAFQQETSWGRGRSPFAPGTAQTTGSASTGPGPASGEVQLLAFLLSQESWTIDWSDSWGNILQAQMEGRRCDDYIVYNKNDEVIDPFTRPPDRSSFPLRFIERPRSNEEQRRTCPWPTSSLRAIPKDFTTLAIRNIPARYSQEMLLMEFQPDGTFDLFYQPYSFRDARTMGYVFINFRNYEMALAFQQKWHRQFLKDHGRTKHLDVAAATVQGVRDNLAQFNLRSVARLRRVSMLPALFSRTGQRLDTITELVRMGIIPFDRCLVED
eukprot:TRINITY_DN44735_c0_g1_i1.p1 TRINITY_DN44735_c0_g1~~TRINITY_DN44735_c0_g1_i1.p1  ORF type:complete len:445 (-),score=57.27 TRINITY_DN44735_c0_g1_i1:490-1824(-)